MKTPAFLQIYSHANKVCENLNPLSHFSKHCYKEKLRRSDGCCCNLTGASKIEPYLDLAPQKCQRYAKLALLSKTLNGTASILKITPERRQYCKEMCLKLNQMAKE